MTAEPTTKMTSALERGTAGDPMADVAPVLVSVADASADARWAGLVASRSTSVFQSQPWLRVLRETYGFPVRAQLLTGSGGAAVAGLVYADVEDFRGRRRISLPFSDFCDPIVDDDDQWRLVARGLLEGDRPVRLRCLHNRVPLGDDRLSLSGRARWHAIDVDREEQEIWTGLHGSARRAIRKAQTSGVSVRYGTGEADLRAFFDLHLRVRKRKYGLLAQPYAFFTRIWEHFLEQGQGVLILSMVDDRPVAGCLFLEWDGTLYYKFNASDPDYLEARPNDRVLWEGITYARERGLQRLDFGLTDWDQEGLVQYKRKYATDEQVISTLAREPVEAGGSQDPTAGAMLGQLTELLVDPRVPAEITERAGDLLYRYFA